MSSYNLPHETIQGLLTTSRIGADNTRLIQPPVPGSGIQEAHAYLSAQNDESTGTLRSGLGDSNIALYGDAVGHAEGYHGHEPAPVASQRKKRVRTGCWTCRERHLKCDEAFPICKQCQKANKDCARGMKARFDERFDERFNEPFDERLDSCRNVLRAPPKEVRYKDGPEFGQFKDNSIEIAMDLEGERGKERYAIVENQPLLQTEKLPLHRHPGHGYSISSTASHQSHALNQPMDLTSETQSPADNQPLQTIHDAFRDSESQPFQAQWESGYAYPSMDQPQIVSSFDDSKTITDGEELVLMQVFINEVARWMDTMTSVKYVSLQRSSAVFSFAD